MNEPDDTSENSKVLSSGDSTETKDESPALPPIVDDTSENSKVLNNASDSNSESAD